MTKKHVILLILLVISGLLFASEPVNVRLSWSGNTATTQTVNWTTDTNTTVGKIQYKKASSSYYRTVDADAVVYDEYGDPVKLWSKTLTGLYEDTTYKYRVGDGVNWSPYYTFETAEDDADEFKFIVIGDSANEDLEYSGDENMLKENLTMAFSKNPDAKFLLNTGDTVDLGRLYEHWAAWLDAAKDFVCRVPFMLTVSKDDCNAGEDPITEDDLYGFPDLFTKVWNYPDNGPAPYQKQAYSFDYGKVHIASIPTQVVTYYPDDEAAQVEMLETIAAWLDADLTAASDSEWKIVLSHIDFYQTMSDRGAVLQRKIIQPILDKHHVDIVFDGHNHTIARTYPIYDNKLKSNPEDGTVYYTTGCGEWDSKEDVQKKIWHHFSFDAQTNSNYLVVEVDDEELEIKCYLADGTLVDEYEIDKDDPEDCTPTIAPREYNDPHVVVLGTLLGFWNPDISEEYGEGLPFKDNDPEEEIPDLITNGEWCFDVVSIAAVINGKWFPDEKTLKYDDLELELEFPADTVSACGNYVSEVGLEAVGFDVMYDEDLNLWFFDRYR